MKFGYFLNKPRTIQNSTLASVFIVVCKTCTTQGSNILILKMTGYLGKKILKSVVHNSNVHLKFYH